MKRKQQLFFVLFCLVIALLSLAPYWTHGVNLEHDTCFHLSRIEGLAQSFKDGIFMPRIYPYKNNNFGYASPLFYCDFFLIIPALLYNAGLSLARSYQFLLLLCSFFSAWYMGKLTMKLSRQQPAMYLAAFLYVFSLYRFTDIYVRGALGEVLAFVFMPVALIGIYEVLWGDEKKWSWLMTGTGILRETIRLRAETSSRTKHLSTSTRTGTSERIDFRVRMSKRGPPGRKERLILKFKIA